MGPPSTFVTYLDTSVLMALVCPELMSDYVKGWYARSEGEAVLTSPWIYTELASAVAIKLRTKQMAAEEVPLALQAGKHVIQTTRCVPIETEDFQLAAEFCSLPGSTLRGPDALHLAAAQRLGCTHLATLDDVMREFGLKIGLEAVGFKHGI
jgi:predicted nucleic acid-binding protein